MNKLMNKETITSLELCKQINIFREQDGKSELEHKTLMRTIRDELEEEIGQNIIVPSEYINSQGKKQPMFVLTLSQAKQVLVRDSKAVRKVVIHYIEELEEALRIPKLTQEERMLVDIALSKDKAQQMALVAEYGTIKWDNGYALGQNDKEQELIPVIDGLQDKVKTQEKVINANLTTTQVVNILNRENDLGTKKLTTTMFFDYLAYCGYGERKPYGDSCYSRTKFYANEAMQDTLHKFGLGKVTITKTKYGEIHDFKFTRDFVDDITVEKLIEFMYRDENKDKLF